MSTSQPADHSNFLYFICQSVNRKLKEMSDFVEKTNKDICSLLGKNKETEKYIRKQKDIGGNSSFVTGISWFGFFAFTCLGAYQMSKLMTHYRSEPVAATVNIIQTNVFEWPTVTIQTVKKYYNWTAINTLLNENVITYFLEE